MSNKFTSEWRGRLPNVICSHFDKYCEIINPVTFDPIEDIYRQIIPDREWNALQVLLDSRYKSAMLSLGFSFDLYMGSKKTSKYQRTYISFTNPDGKSLPNLDLEIEDLSGETQDAIKQWAGKAVGLKKLRSFLWRRLECALDNGWDPRKYWDSYRATFRGGATSGMGCNTANQLVRLWPELGPLMPRDFKHDLVQAQVKSRLPKFIANHGTPAQFRLVERPYHRNEYDPTDDPALKQSEPYTDEEWEIKKRMLEGVNHILTQMSLMTDVPHNKEYPTVYVRN